MKYLALLLIFFVFISCNNKNSLKKNYSTIDFENSISKDLYLSEISDSLRFILLEYDKENLVGNIINYKITKDYIFIVDAQQKLFVFDKDGKLISTIFFRGRGPAEYNYIEDFTIDPDQNHVFILDPSSFKILKYTINGEFIKNFPIKFGNAAHISYLDDDKYCIYQSSRFSADNFNLFITDSSFNTISEISYHGERDFVKSLPYLMTIQWYSFSNNVFYKEAFQDTIFKINSGGNIKPHILLDFGDKSMPEKYFTSTKYYQMGSDNFYQLTNILESDKYIFLEIYYENKRNYYLYEKEESGTLYKLDTDQFFINDDVDLNFWPSFIDSDGVMYQFVDAGELYNNLSNTTRANKLKLELEYNDNPVLISCQLNNLN